MNLTLSGLPAIAIAIGFVVVFSLPVWLAARITGASNATVLHSACALVLGTIGTVLAGFATGAWALLLGPICFLLSFKFVLGTSFFGALLLGIVAVIGYAAMIHFIGGGAHFSNQPAAG